MRKTKASEQKAVNLPMLEGTCPYCLSEIDVCFDIKFRPYWRCGACDLRTFGTRAALRKLQEEGWVFTGKRPFELLAESLLKRSQALRNKDEGYR